MGTDQEALHTLYALLTPYLRYFVETPTVQVKLAYLEDDLLNRRMENLLTDLPVVDLRREDAAFEKADLEKTSVDNEPAIKAAGSADCCGEKIVWMTEEVDNAIAELYLQSWHLYLKKTDALLSADNDERL